MTRRRRATCALTAIALAAWAGACATGAGDDSSAPGQDAGHDGTHGGGYDATYDYNAPDSSDANGQTGDDGSSEAGDDAGNEAASGDDSSSDALADAPPDATSDAGPLVVFVSSQLYSGNLGGLTGADSTCQTLAAAVGLPGTYKAWLSDSTGSGSASARLSHGAGAYVLVSGTVVANGWTKLTSGTLTHAIDQTEDGGAPPMGTVGCSSTLKPHVWTATNFLGGAVATESCTDWTSASASAVAGLTGTTSAASQYWTQYCAIAGCNLTAAIYCFEQ